LASASTRFWRTVTTFIPGQHVIGAADVVGVSPGGRGKRVAYQHRFLNELTSNERADKVNITVVAQQLG
jgi:hypothetical protein